MISTASFTLNYKQNHTVAQNIQGNYQDYLIRYIIKLSSHIICICVRAVLTQMRNMCHGIDGNTDNDTQHEFIVI